MSEHLPEQATVIEVGPRDGLQAEARMVPADKKAALIDRLAGAGLKHIQAASFVHPRAVPQMADAEAVCARIKRVPGVVYSGLALNLKGVERAARAGLDLVDCSISTSDTHSRKNTGMSLDEARTAIKAMTRRAREAGLGVRAGLQNVWRCNYEGPTPLDKAADLTAELADLGVDMISLADSTGSANPRSMKRLLRRIAPIVGEIPVALHLHDTRGLALACVVAALECGVTHFDASFGGLGGCPFIPGATGNVATEDLLNLLHGMGVATGVDIGAVAACSLEMERYLEKRLPGAMHALIGAGQS